MRSNSMAHGISALLIILHLFFLVLGRNHKHHGNQYICKPCGTNLCCCHQETAVCQNHGRNLTYIPSLQNITRLKFENNYLTNLSKDSFANLSTVGIITTLSLGNNRITNISANVFTSFHRLQKLNISYNFKINKHQLWKALGSVQKTQPLNLLLRGTGLVDLKDDMFSPLTDSNLTRIDLADNDIEEFKVEPFQGLESLEYIFLNKNKIRGFTRNATLINVQYLNLDDNAIVGRLDDYGFCSETPGKSIFPNLRTLLLMDNYISFMKPHSFHCLMSLEKLNLNGNVMKVIETNTFNLLYSLKELQFAYMHRSIREIKDYAFNNSNMKYLNFRENYMRLQPDTAKMMFQNSPNLTNLDISLTNLKRISAEQVLEMLSPLKLLEKLTASRCQIIRLDSRFMKTFPNLKYLSLEGNSIHELGAFKAVYSLKVLSLQGNSLNGVKENDVTENFMTSLEKINLSNNPFDCTCSLLWFRTMTNDGKGKFGSIALVSWPYRYECMTPADLMKTDLLDYRPTKSSCANLMLIVVIGLVVFIVVMSAISVITFRYRWYIRYWFYKLNSLKKKNKDPERNPLLGNVDPRYDGFVIYNTDDDYFVHYDFRTFMEDKHGYQLHIWERDGAVGGSKIEVIVDGIYASQYAVAVISKNSLQDSWAMFQINVALDRQVELKRDFLMLVVLEDFDFRKLSRYWCVMLTKMHSATWCQHEGDVRQAVFEQRVTRHFRDHRTTSTL